MKEKETKRKEEVYKGGKNGRGKKGGEEKIGQRGGKKVYLINKEEKRGGG